MNGSKKHNTVISSLLFRELQTVIKLGELIVTHKNTIKNAGNSNSTRCIIYFYWKPVENK